MKQFIRIDLAKNYFQVQARADEGTSALTRKLTRLKMGNFSLPESTPVSSAWTARRRELKAMGHHVRLIAPIYVKPYVKGGKNDAADAAAICEAIVAARHAFRADKERGKQMRLWRPRRLGAREQIPA